MVFKTSNNANGTSQKEPSVQLGYIPSAPYSG